MVAAAPVAVAVVFAVASDAVAAVFAVASDAVAAVVAVLVAGSVAPGAAGGLMSQRWVIRVTWAAHAQTAHKVLGTQLHPACTWWLQPVRVARLGCKERHCRI